VPDLFFLLHPATHQNNANTETIYRFGFYLNRVNLCSDARNLRTYLLTYSMEQSPSYESNRFSGSQEIPCNLWNPKVHYRIHKCPLPVPILSQLNPVRIPVPEDPS